MSRIPGSFQNPVSLAGAGIALVTLGAILVFFLMEMFGAVNSPYLGIFTYLILPGVMIAGLLMIPLGAFLERRRLRRSGGAERRYVVVDLNKPSHRTAMMIFTVGTMFLIILSAAGTYQAYHYSESVEFCGTVCHEVMHPEYTAYQHSPHARVPCAGCHIGDGADWFVKAKLSGVYQVYSVIFDKFSRPIETPIHNLRPARETCERCHWPEKFSANLEMAKTYYPIDTGVSQPWSIVLQLKIGGGRSELGPVNGIHWHMNTENTVEYIAVDEKRQVIPWVRTVRGDGTVKTFKSLDVPADEAELARHELRKVDCIDCHNRPSHIYYPPFRTVNDAMAAGRLDPSLPNIRGIASRALTGKYAGREEALSAIGHFVRDQYALNAPSVLREKAGSVGRAIDEIRRVYTRNFFPEMKVDWRAYPNNIGHMYDEGCSRCHDGRHVTGDGEVLASDCNICHLVVAQGPRGAVMSDLQGLDFIHPSDIGGAEREMKCAACHTGE